jgi:hypothetical protein
MIGKSVLRTINRFLLIAGAIPPTMFGWGDCALPATLCERLNPGMVVFIGRQVSLFRDQYRLPTVTFEIQEQLWGLSGQRVATVFFADGYRDSVEPQFIAVTPTGNGRYRHDDCGSGILLPIRHPWVQEFRRNVMAHRSARVSVLVHSSYNYIPVAGTYVRLSGNGQVFAGTTHGMLPLDLGMLPPGDYQCMANRPNFSHEAGNENVSILPGSCTTLRVPMTPISAVSGRIVNFRGEPVRNASFGLKGQVRAVTQHDSIYDWAGESVRTVLYQMGWRHAGQQDYYASHGATTDNDGRFVFKGIFPGRYYLLSDIGEINEAWKLPLPKTYYPGVHDWRLASTIVVEEGQSVTNILFRLPDFGQKRSVQIQVVSEDGMPVAGAIVQDSGLDPNNEKAANVGMHKTTDVAGRVAFDVWPICDYRLVATLYLPHKWSSSDVFEVPPGTAPVSVRMKLKDLRLRDRKQPSRVYSK